MKTIAAFARDRSGVAMMEFALVLPILLTLGLGTLDLGRFVLANLRCAQIAQTVADNAGRVRYAMDEANVNEVMIGGKLIGNGIDFAKNGRIILSDLEQRTNTDGAGGKGAVTKLNPKGYRQWIRWQRCVGNLKEVSSYGGPIDKGGAAVKDLDSTANADHGAAENVSKIDGMGPAGQQIASAANTAVMVVEVFYQFKPMSIYLPLTDSQLKIHVVQAFNIRERTAFGIANANHLTGASRADCERYDEDAPV